MKILKNRVRATTGAACLASFSLLLACGGGGADSDSTDSDDSVGAGGAVGNSGGAVGNSGGAAGNSGGAAGNSGGAAGNSGGAVGNSGGMNGDGGTVENTGGMDGGVGVGGQEGGGGSGNPVDCNITITESAPSPSMGSVGIVEFTSDLAGITTASIEFGATSAYGMVAPVDLAETNYRTPLLGLPFNSELNYRVVVTDGEQTCTSENQTMTLTGQPNGVNGSVSVTSGDGTETTEGFIVSSIYNGGVVFITNMQGELVWLKNTALDDSSQANLSYDGKYMYARNGNPSGGPAGQIVRMKIDGSGEETIPASTSHHDFAFLPNGSLLYVRRSTGTAGNCDTVIERTFDGEETELFEVADALPSFSQEGNGDDCHTNSIRYNEHNQSITLSMLNLSTLLNFDVATGAVNWVMGLQDPTLNMNGLSWEAQHGTHMPDENTLYFFNNRGNTSHGDGESVVLKVDLTGDSVAVDPVFFDSTPNTFSQGDVQELPNGNVLVTYSNAGVAHEFSPSGEEIRVFSFAGGVGYSTYRATLYGPPPR